MVFVIGFAHGDHISETMRVHRIDRCDYVVRDATIEDAVKPIPSTQMTHLFYGMGGPIIKYFYRRIIIESHS